MVSDYSVAEVSIRTIKTIKRRKPIWFIKLISTPREMIDFTGRIRCVVVGPLPQNIFLLYRVQQLAIQQIIHLNREISTQPVDTFHCGTKKELSRIFVS